MSPATRDFALVGSARSARWPWSRQRPRGALPSAHRATGQQGPGRRPAAGSRPWQREAAPAFDRVDAVRTARTLPATRVAATADRSADRPLSSRPGRPRICRPTRKFAFPIPPAPVRFQRDLPPSGTHYSLKGGRVTCRTMIPAEKMADYASPFAYGLVAWAGQPGKANTASTSAVFQLTSELFNQERLPRATRCCGRWAFSV